MKTRKNIITVLTLCVALSLTACTGKETKDTTDTQTTDAAPTPESSSEINDLFQQENQLFADHQSICYGKQKLGRPKRKLWGLPC